MNNIGSIVFGLLAWGGAVAALLRRRPGLSTRSFGAYALPLLLQLFEVRRLVGLRDWSALEDTIHAVVLAAVTLTLVTGLLNLAAWIRIKKTGT